MKQDTNDRTLLLRALALIAAMLRRRVRDKEDLRLVVELEAIEEALSQGWGVKGIDGAVNDSSGRQGRSLNSEE